MVRVLKLQKAVWLSILGGFALLAYSLMAEQNNSYSNYVLSASGLLFITGAFLFMYPILFAKKDKEGMVELEPDKQQDIVSDDV